jgi:hypothetical protein
VANGARAPESDDTGERDAPTAPSLQFNAQLAIAAKEF